LLLIIPTVGQRHTPSLYLKPPPLIFASLFAVLQRLQDHQVQASKAEENAVARPDDADAAHDRDFASLKSIVAEALADAEQLQRLWRSIDVTSNAVLCVATMAVVLIVVFV
jgi:hypothetical protein